MENEANEKAQGDESVALQIILTKDGGVRIQGPVLADRMASYGLLEIAKDMIREMHTPKIIKPNGGILNFARNGKH